MKHSMVIVVVLLTVIYMSSCSTSKNNAQGFQKNYVPASKELYDTIARMDSLLFDAFNSCRVEAFTNLLTNDVEFYHDESGLMVSSKTQSEGLKTRCAEQNRNGILRRELVKETLEVYPLPNYGAVEIGVHNFYRTLSGQPEKLTTVARFVNIWQQKNGQWKVSRIISYGHAAMK